MIISLIALAFDFTANFTAEKFELKSLLEAAVAVAVVFGFPPEKRLGRFESNGLHVCS